MSMKYDPLSMAFNTYEGHQDNGQWYTTEYESNVDTPTILVFLYLHSYDSYVVVSTLEYLHVMLNTNYYTTTPSGVEHSYVEHQ